MEEKKTEKTNFTLIELIAKHKKTGVTAIRPLEFMTLVCLDIQ